MKIQLVLNAQVFKLVQIIFPTFFLVKKQAFTNSGKSYDVFDSTTGNILQIFEKFSSMFML